MMRTLKERKIVMKEVEHLVTQWFDYVEIMGNECAYTDGIMLEIVKRTRELYEEV